METTAEQELKQIQLKIPAEQYDRIRAYAEKNALAITTVVKLAVKNFLDKNATK
jgi:ABC-type sulfate transport system permease subunit